LYWTSPNFIDKDLDKAHALADNNYTGAGERETNSAPACREGALDVAHDIGRNTSRSNLSQSVCIDAEQQIFWLFSALQANCARAKDAASAMACGALFNERSEKNAMRKTQE